ncbi:putative salivary secreted peptide [Ptiloglossa arizonensis]|uniref:putative salivary secreted peptide n=1 Tax=Ptiloglossa arizonensis TaxID=3350558 RepID=UPI003FA0A1BE
MSAQKAIICLAIVAIAVLATEADPAAQYGYVSKGANKSHDLIVGSRLPGDRLVLRQSVVKNSSWMKVIVVEKTFNVSRFDRITTVAARDQKTNGNGAYPSLIKGGPGYNNVTLKFKSQRGHGINFIVELFARP